MHTHADPYLTLYSAIEKQTGRGCALEYLESCGTKSSMKRLLYANYVRGQANGGKLRYEL